MCNTNANLSTRYGFLGCGNMATAIISGMINNDISTPENIYVYDIDSEKCRHFTDKGAVKALSENDLATKCDVIFICVKPQVIGYAVSKISNAGDTLFISIAAGISTSYLASILGENAKIIRVMPNTPLLIGEGATALCSNSHVSVQEKDSIKNVFSSLGVVEEISETLMNEIISVNGSMPAIVYYFIDASIKSAVAQGIDENVAKNLVCATFVGSAKMLKDSPLSPDELIKIVCSPGGTTERAVAVLRDKNTDEIVNEAMVQCTKRAYQLEK